MHATEVDQSVTVECVSFKNTFYTLEQDSGISVLAETSLIDTLLYCLLLNRRHGRGGNAS